MFDVSFLLILIIIVALIFDFTNGAHDCANAIATVVSTKVLSPRTVSYTHLVSRTQLLPLHFF